MTLRILAAIAVVRVLAACGGGDGGGGGSPAGTGGETGKRAEGLAVAIDKTRATGSSGRFADPARFAPVIAATHRDGVVDRRPDRKTGPGPSNHAGFAVKCRQNFRQVSPELPSNVAGFAVKCRQILQATSISSSNEPRQTSVSRRKTA